MPRVLLTVVLPLLLPTALYLLWVTTLRPAQRNGAPLWRVLPWVWLAAAGVVLLAIVLFVVTVHFGMPQEGVYVPPRWENGHIVPGHMERKPGQ
ncbi:MAG: hypothetical protein JO282_04070 [Alphaproteobacteria bacterium]|nr:hypothetical protein [Alphaproteobacteria bacterium]